MSSSPETDYCGRERPSDIWACPPSCSRPWQWSTTTSLAVESTAAGGRAPRLGAVQKRVRHTVKKNMSVPMVRVPVGDAFIEAGRTQGEVRVSVRAVCDALDVNFSSQLAKLKKKRWAGVALIAIPSRGGP